MTGTRTGSPEQAADLLRAAASILEPRSAATAGQLRRAATDLEDARCRVVVAGAPKQGKSSLVNALVGVPGLVPLDVDLATSTCIVVQRGSVPGAWAWVDRAEVGASADGTVEAVPIPFDALAEWAAVGSERSASVARVDVAVPEVPAGIVLVDTPGVGSLEAGHTEITLAVLEEADTLVFVTSAAAPLSASELAFLERASRRADAVHLVLTRSDQYPHWEQVLQQDRAAVARSLPHLADAPWYVVPVGPAPGAPDAAAAILALRSALLQTSTDLVAPRGDRLLRYCDTLLAEEEVRTSVAGRDDEERRRRRVLLDRSRAQAAGLREAAKGFRPKLQAEAARRATRIEAEGRARIKDVQLAATGSLAEAKVIDAEELRRDLVARLRAALVDADAELRREVVDAAVSLLPLPTAAPDSASASAPRWVPRFAGADGEVDPSLVEIVTEWMDALRYVFFGLAISTTARRMFGTASGVQTRFGVAEGLGVAAGVVQWWGAQEGRKLATTRGELGPWIARTCEDAGLVLGRHLRERQQALVDDLGASLGAGVQDRCAWLDGQVAELELLESAGRAPVAGDAAPPVDPLAVVTLRTRLQRHLEASAAAAG